MKNLVSSLLLIPALISLTACNLFGGLSSPSNDAQHLDAARACLDRNDYPCALEHYQALSNSYSDIKKNETSLAELAQAQVFSFQDLISSLGTSLGNGRTLSAMAELIATRQAATAANRLLIQRTFARNSLIQTEIASPSEAKLRAFSKFISAFTMFNAVLASAVGADGVLTVSDISSGPSSGPGSCADNPVNCDGSATSLPDTSAPFDPLTDDLNDSTNWDSTPSLDMLFVALEAANNEISNFSGSGSGILSVISQLGGLATPAIKRQQLILLLGLQ